MPANKPAAEAPPSDRMQLAGVIWGIESAAGLIRIAAVLTVVMVSVWCTNAVLRAPFNDEAWIGSSAHNLRHSGELKTTVLETRGTYMEGAERRSYWVFPLQPVLQSIALRAAGRTTGATLRIVSVAGGLALLFAVYRFTSRYTGSVLGAWLATMLTSCDYVIFSSASTARPEILVAGFGYLALLALTYDSVAAHVGAGVCLTAAFLCHPYSLVCAGICACFVVAASRYRRGWKLAAIGLAGAAAGLVLLAWGSRDWALFVRHLSGNAGAGRSMQSPWTAVAREFTERLPTAYGLTEFSPGLIKSLSLVLLLATAAAVAARTTDVWRRVREARLHAIAMMLVGGWATLAVLDSKKFSYYWTPLSPLVAVGTAVLWTVLRARRPQAGHVLLRWYFAAAILLTAAASWSALRTSVGPVNTVAGLVQQQRTTGTVFAPATVALQTAYPEWMVDDRRLGFLSGRVPEVIVTDAEYRRVRLQSPSEAEYRSRLLSQFSRFAEVGEYQVLVRLRAR
jgi:4-amino-4-deoxy-L-arabinose transferase-like glycosyltransferase